MNARTDIKHLKVSVPPYSVEAESGVLGALLLDSSAFDRIGDMVKADDFYRHEHKTIYAEISRMANTGKSIDMLTVWERLEAAGTAADVGGLAYLNELAQYVPSAANLRRYAQIVADRSLSRKLLVASAEIGELAHDQATPFADRLDLATAHLSKLAIDAPRDEWISASAGMAAHTQVLEDREAGRTTAMPTGLAGLDDYLEGGLNPGQLVIVGARPSMGKSALGLTIGVNMASNYTVGFLSMEMSHAEINDRLTAMLGTVSLSMVKRPQRGMQWDRVIDGVERAKLLNLYVSDQGNLNINQVRAKARNLKRLFGLNVLVVDYIGLMAGLDPKQNRNTQLEEVSRGFKSLAKELSICVVCLAQLNRQNEAKADSMPMMSDLRDSGAIEQDADAILFIKRPIMANPELGPQWQNYAKLSIAKNRQGRCGYLNLSYAGELTKFDEWQGQPPSKSNTRFGGEL